jgi:hypothetical protein
MPKEQTFGLVQFTALRDEIIAMTGDNVPADIWCRLDEFINEFNNCGPMDRVLAVSGTIDFMARLYCMCAYVWTYDSSGHAPSDSQEYVINKLNECIKGLMV